MNSRFDHVAFLLRARHAVLGAGSLTFRRNGSISILTSEIPGTRIRAMVREKGGRTTGAFMQQRGRMSDIDLDSVADLFRFIYTWDTMLMTRGIGASYFPVAALEFVDALIFDEGRRDILSIRGGVNAAAGFAIVPTAEWMPTPELAALIEQYEDDDAASPAARSAARDLAGFMADGNEKPFDRNSWGRRSIVRALREACRDGREIGSLRGTWREVLSAGGVRCAVEYLAAQSPDAAAASAAMSSHLGIFTSHHQNGGCDFYLLWNDEQIPFAIAAVAADGTFMSVTAPGLPDAIRCDEDVGALVDAAGSDFPVRPIGVPGHPQP